MTNDHRVLVPRNLLRCLLGMLMTMAAFAIGGCGGASQTAGNHGSQAAQKGGTITIGLKTEMVTFDPQEAVDPSSIKLIPQIVETLYRTDQNGKVIPWLVSKSETTDNGLVWTFTLKKGIKFSNGTPLTSADVVFTLDGLRKNPNWGFLFEAITKVEGPTADTVVVRTKVPIASMLAKLSLFAAGIVPKNYGGMTPKQFGQHPIGTGPYELGEWKHGQSVTLEANPLYWQAGQPISKKVIIYAVPDDNSRLAQLRGGELDLIESPPWSQLSAIEQNPSLQLGVYAYGLVDYLFLNTRTELFENPKVRAAVNLAVDRKGIVNAALGGYGKVAGAWLAPSVLYHNPTLKSPARNVARAAQLLKEARAETGVEPKFKLLVNSGGTYAATASQIIQSDLSEAGFSVEVTPVDEATNFEELGTGTYDASLMPLNSDIVDPSESVSLYPALEGFWTGANSDEVAALSTKGESEFNTTKRRNIYYEVQKVVQKEDAMVPLDYAPYVWGMQGNIAGFEVNVTAIPWFAEMGFSG